MEGLPGVTEIGNWSEIKLQILKEYALQYSVILSKQSYLKHIYIDAFAGAGVHILRDTKGFVLGSPLNALYVEPPFKELHLIDLDGKKIEILKELTNEYDNVHIYEGDSNSILLNEVFPKVKYEDYRRGLCLLDPYGLHLEWEVLETAAAMKSIEIFLNFPIMDMNRNVFWRDIEAVDAKDIARMTSFWGDDSWKGAAYSESPQMSLFGEDRLLKEPNYAIAEKFRERLKTVAGFKFVPEPIPMRNSTGATIYYLFFASNNETGTRIAEHILNKYRDKGIK
jgi:three-Cys-motif partner protein